MKFNKLNAGMVSCLLVAALSGCDKNSSSTMMDDAKKTAESATTATQQGMEKAATEVKQAGEKAVEAVTEKVKAAGGEAAGVITKAQGLVTEKKYQEALTALSGLKDVKLSDSQQKVVDGLKEQIQKLMSGDAGKAVGNLLGK